MQPSNRQRSKSRKKPNSQTRTREPSGSRPKSGISISKKPLESLDPYEAKLKKEDLKLRIQMKEQELANMVKNAKTLNIRIKGKEFQKVPNAKKEVVSRMKSKGIQLEVIEKAKQQKSPPFRKSSKSPAKQTIKRLKNESHDKQLSQHTIPLRLKIISGPTASFEDEQSLQQRISELTKHIENQHNAPKRMSPLRLLGTDPEPKRSPNMVTVQNSNEKSTDEKPIIKPQPIIIQEFESRKLEKAFDKLKDRVSSMNADNSTLRNKIELAILDLEKVNQEKIELQRLLSVQNRRVPQRNRELQSIEAPDKEPLDLKNKIVFQRKQNEQLQERLTNIKKYEYQGGTGDKEPLTVEKVVQQLENELHFRTLDNEVIKRQNLSLFGQIEISSDALAEQQSDHVKMMEELKRLEVERDKTAGESLNLRNQLQILNSKFEIITRETNAEHFYFKRGNSFNNKRIVGQTLANVLNIFIHNNKKNAFNEIKEYSNFDDKCYGSLKRLTRVLDKVGHFKMRKFLLRWYDNSMKPMQTIKHNEVLAFKIYKSRFLSRSFYAWRELHNDQMSSYQSKTNSIALIWSKLNQFRDQEIKRAIQIWKEKSRFNNNKDKALKRLLLNRYKSVLCTALQFWKQYNSRLGTECRLVMMQREYAHKMYLSLVFQKLKEECFALKMNRIKTMRVVVKAWKEYVMEKRHFILQNVQANKFMRAREKLTLSILFGEMKNNWRKQQYQVLRMALQTDVDVSLEGYIQLNRRLRQTATTSTITQAFTLFKVQLSKSLYSYFKQWFEATRNFKIATKSRISDFIIKAYRNKLRNAFNVYRANCAFKNITLKKKKVMDMRQEYLELEDDNIFYVKIARVQSITSKSLIEKKSSKTFKKFYHRILERALTRWKKRVQQINKTKSQTETVLQKVRRRILKEVFDVYVDFLNRSKQHGKNVKTANFHIETLKNRSLRKHFNAICAFTNNHIRAKRYCSKLLHRIDFWMKQSSMKKWKNNSNLKKLWQLQQVQNSVTSLLEQRNHKIGVNETQNEETQKKMKKLSFLLKKKGHKQLGNYIARFYRSTTGKTFKKWKNSTIYQGQKDKLLLRTIEHMRKSQMTAVRNAFKTFISQEVCKNRKQAIKHVTMEGDDEVHAMQYAEIKMEKVRKKADVMMVKSAGEQAFHMNRRDKARAILERRNMTLTFISKKRKVFEALKKTGKQHRAFCLCVSTVLSKSMTTKGFLYIQRVARENHQNYLKKRHINLMILRFLKKNIGDFFNKWKNGALVRVETKYNEVNGDYLLTINEFSQLICNVKDQNTSNMEHFLMKRRLKAIYKGWKKVSHKNKTRRIQTEESVGVLKAVKQKQSLQKWFLRVVNTKIIRRNYKIMKLNKAIRLKKMVWEGILGRRKITNHLTSSLCNLERLFLDKGRIEAFRTLLSYSNSKKHASKILKHRALMDIQSILEQRHTERVRRFFQRYKGVVKTRVKKNLEAKRILLKVQIGHIRWAFTQWAKQTEKMVFAQELNEVGPVTEQVFEANRCIRNLTCFMKKERYTQEEIQYWIKKAKDTNDYQMIRAIARFKISRENKVMCRCFEHWTMWIKIKRLMKYHLNFANAQVQPVKCDIRWAFEKWKRADAMFSKHLSTFDNRSLQQMSCQQSEHLNRLADGEAQNSAIISHLNEQRNQLLDHKIRASRLALSLLHENYKKDLRIAINKWKAERKIYNKKLGVNHASQQVDHVAKLKKKAANLQLENDQIAEENDQLRQFSFEGFEIAKTVTQLADEKKKLSADLADQDDLLRQLLEQKDSLISELKKLGKLDTLGQINDKNSKFMNQTFVRGETSSKQMEYDNFRQSTSKERKPI